MNYFMKLFPAACLSFLSLSVFAGEVADSLEKNFSECIAFGKNISDLVSNNRELVNNYIDEFQQLFQGVIDKITIEQAYQVDEGIKSLEEVNNQRTQMQSVIDKQVNSIEVVFKKLKGFEEKLFQEQRLFHSNGSLLSYQQSFVETVRDFENENLKNLQELLNYVVEHNDDIMDLKSEFIDGEKAIFDDSNIADDHTVIAKIKLDGNTIRIKNAVIRQR